MWHKDSMLAFVHIEKAAGTTLIHILRRNFFLRYLDVRPLTRESPGVLTARDLRGSLRLNPFLRCIAGHSIKPFGDLHEVYPRMRYVTVLRDPIDRYLSQFRYWNRKLSKGWAFERFLEHKLSHNFQTRKIAGSEDLGLAKQILRERFMLVGLVEEFDEFLLLLRDRLAPSRFDPYYHMKNVGGESRSDVDDRFAPFRDAIESNNRLDIELYRFARDELMPLQRAGYRGDLETDLAGFRCHARPGPVATVKAYVDGFFRKVYYEPVTGLIRYVNRLPVSGSY